MTYQTQVGQLSIEGCYSCVNYINCCSKETDAKMLYLTHYEWLSEEDGGEKKPGYFIENVLVCFHNNRKLETYDAHGLAAQPSVSARLCGYSAEERVSLGGRNWLQCLLYGRGQPMLKCTTAT